MQLVMVGYRLSVPVLAGQKGRADQDMIEAESCGVLELCRPLRQCSDEKRVDEIDSWRIRVKHVMVFHRSSFPVRPAMAWMRENAIALNQAINQPHERLRQTSLRQSSSTNSGVSSAVRIFMKLSCAIRRSVRRQGRVLGRST
jgi:hypothetical protein